MEEKNVTIFKCLNPNCGDFIVLKCKPEDVVNKFYTCKICGERYKIKDALTAMNEQSEQTGLFKNNIVLLRDMDSYPYLFFEGRTTFGRLDETMQSDVLISTDDLTINSCHVAITVKPCAGGHLASLTNLSQSGICNLNGKSLGWNDISMLEDNMVIQLGKTSFQIKDLKKEEL